ncbi:MAG: NAD(P)-dependent oxidoreductase [Anaerolineaceae bacterium]|nr:NAD(P)-dependent oxidoreductase [Anaerolineaceae bacterium]
MSLAGKSVFVTGATGFLGGALVRRLAADGAQVKALARNPDRADYIRGLDGVEIVKGDVTEPDSLARHIPGVEIVFHVAAIAFGNMEKQRAVNVEGTRNVAMAASQAGVGRLVHVSTVSVYGYHNQGLVTEDRPQVPGTPPYNRTKSLAEAALKQIADAHDLAYSIIRPSMIYGPRSTFWTKQFFGLAKRKPTIFIGKGQGNCYPIYVDDVVDLMTVLATHPAAVSEAFNCSPDPAPTWRAFMGAYQRLAGHSSWLGIPESVAIIAAPVIEFFLKLRGEPQDLPALIDQMIGETTYSTEKARTLLNWQPQVSLEEGVNRCVPYLREEGLLK